MILGPPAATLFPYTTLFRSHIVAGKGGNLGPDLSDIGSRRGSLFLRGAMLHPGKDRTVSSDGYATYLPVRAVTKRSEEHTSELQSLTNLVCRLLLEKKNLMKPSLPEWRTASRPAVRSVTE